MVLWISLKFMYASIVATEFTFLIYYINLIVSVYFYFLLMRIVSRISFSFHLSTHQSITT